MAAEAVAPVTAISKNEKVDDVKVEKHFVVVCRLDDGDNADDVPWRMWLGSQCFKTPTAERERFRRQLSNREFEEMAANYDYDWANDDIVAGDFYDCYGWAEDKAKHHVICSHHNGKRLVGEFTYGWECIPDCVCHTINFPMQVMECDSILKCQKLHDEEESRIDALGSDSEYTAIVSFSLTVE
jgi:hypothetical protein